MIRKLPLIGQKLHKLFHPEIFQGHPSRKKYFEGWYFKLVSGDQQHAIAIIPGVAIYDDEEKHAFIQVINGIRQVSAYHTFPIDTFYADKETLSISIDKNHFSTTGLDLDLPELQGKILFDQITPLQTSVLSPGIMGWYSYVPKMQCYHGIVSLYHRVQGSTSGLSGDIDWIGGTGYIEKDWGSSFPACWIWVHCNHFVHQQRASLMASVAHIPWLGSYFPGFIVVLWIEGKEYRFATYNGSRIKCSVLDDRVSLEFKKNQHHLVIHAYRGQTAMLRSPITGQMKGKVNESLQASVEIILKKSGDTIWSSTGTTAGLEVAGDTSILETDAWRR